MISRALLAIVLLLSMAVPVRANDADGLHPSGLHIVGPQVFQTAASNEDQASRFSMALQLAMDHPESFGYPNLDASTGVIEISMVNEDARALAGVLEPRLQPLAFRNVTRSFGELQAIGDEISRFAQAGVDGAELLWKTEPDHINNRIVATVTELHEGLFFELASRFGTESVAVRVNPVRPDVGPHARQSDWSPFYGGAEIRTPSYVCSDGFSWSNGTLWQGMLTAGHCISSGGNVSTPVQSMGSVTSGSRENWNPAYGQGTVYYTGQSVYRGDVALIQLRSDRSAAVRMYRGNATTTDSRIVRLVWGRWSVVGDTYCTGGRTTGDICDFKVSLSSLNIRYTDGTWARNVVEGTRGGDPCPTGGDSGGPVFTIYGDGVAAKGIHSGGGKPLYTCYDYFTDIQHPVQALPGGVMSLP